jgi:hypothetical protein
MISKLFDRRSQIDPDYVELARRAITVLENHAEFDYPACNANVFEYMMEHGEIENRSNRDWIRDFLYTTQAASPLEELLLVQEQIKERSPKDVRLKKLHETLRPLVQNTATDVSAVTPLMVNTMMMAAGMLKTQKNELLKQHHSMNRMSDAAERIIDREVLRLELILREIADKYSELYKKLRA